MATVTTKEMSITLMAQMAHDMSEIILQFTFLSAGYATKHPLNNVMQQLIYSKEDALFEW